MCHVFESDVMADEICQAISLAADIAFQSLLQQRTSAMAVAQRQEKVGGSSSCRIVYFCVQLVSSLVEGENVMHLLVELI